ncbi:MAG: gliding motility-associated C-terminal domain-containing protein [Bacteroidales bacterium]|nr:gliding motility-associated C-terminal domain-containing protein [Bacteroidales bacterium]
MGHIYFVENIGQWEQNFLFKARVTNGAVYLFENKIVFDLYDGEKVRDIMRFKFLSEDEKELKKMPNTDIKYHSYEMSFLNSNKPAIEKEFEYPAYFNYFIGSDPERWKSDVHAWSKITYNGIYDGIDWCVYEQNEYLKHEFRLAPGSNSKDILLEYTDVDNLSIIDGNLSIHTSIGKVLELKPVAWQIVDGDTVFVPCQYNLKGNRVSFSFPESYNKSVELIIDPTLVFSTYSGSTADNWGYTATFDEDGFVYAGGNIFGNGYPTTGGAYQTSYGGNVDVVISKYDTSGTYMIYSTYLGGSGPEVPNSLIVNSANELYILATTGSPNYPVTPGVIDNSFNGGTAYILTYVVNYSSGSDMAITCLNSAGTAIITSSYLGGTANDGLNMSSVLKHNYADDVRGEILLDDNSNVYVVSSTASSDFPTTNGSFQPFFAGGGQDGCITKMDRLLSTIIWSSFLGGTGDDAIYSISLNDDDAPYVAGGTTSTDFPTSSSAVYQTYQGGTADGFVARISPYGSSVVRSTYWGTSAYDQVYFVETDKQSNVYVLGQTGSTGNVLIYNALWNTPGGGQFISKINHVMSNTVWSTRFGTGGGVVDVSPTAFLVDYCNNIYLSAWGGPSLNGFGGTAGLPITSGAFQLTTDNNDYYFLSIKDDASDIVYGSFYGGSSSEHVDGGTSRFDRLGRIYQSVCAGCGGYDDFPTSSGAWSNTNNSTNCNNGVIKMDFNLPAIVADFDMPPVICLPDTVDFMNESYFPNPGISTCYWDFGNGDFSNSCNPSYEYLLSGIYDVTLIVTDATSCNQADTIVKQIIVLSNTTDTLASIGMCLGDVNQIGIPPIADPSITYLWTPSTFLSSNSISNPTAGPPVSTLYTLEISNGYCTDTLLQMVEVFDLQVYAGADTLICAPSLILEATATGGNNITYQWSSDSQFSDMLNASYTDNTAPVIYTAPHWYYVIVDNGYCTAIDSIFVDYQAISTPITDNMPLCNGDCNGSLTVNPSGGLSPYVYTWSNGGNTATINNICAGTYTVTVEDQQGCLVIDNFTLNEPPLLQYSGAATPVNCDVACNGAITGFAQGGTPPLSFTWNSGGTTEDLNNLCQGAYYLTLTDENGCEALDTFFIVVDYIYANIDVWADDDTIYQGQSTDLHSTPIPAVDYTWNPPEGLSNIYDTDPTASPNTTTTYYVELDDGYGCKYIDSVTIVVLEVFCFEPYIFIPNSFTPNGDGQNDVLYIRSQYIEQLYFAIFDRWGEKVFESTDPSLGWDGTFRGELLEPAVYDYYLEIHCYNQLQFFKKGNITLLR